MSLVFVKDVSKIFSEDFSVKELSFEIEEKGIYGFLGESGSGKTLICEILAGMCAPDEGEIVFKDRSLYKKERLTAEIKKKIGYVPAKCFYDSNHTVMEVMELVGSVRGVAPDKKYRQIKEALELLGLSLKNDTMVDDLSLSERKRLCIAAALIGNPDVLIMDEPFAYLEGQQSEEIYRLLSMLGKKKVVLMFTARASYVEKLADTTAFISGGKLVLWENTAELLAKLSENRLGGLAEALRAFAEADADEEVAE